jgi:hypothetical protein
MSTFDFSALKANAVANNNSKTGGAVPSYLLSLDDARLAVKIKDGNKKPAEDKTQALTLTIGRITIALDAIAPKATRINATEEQVPDFTAQLQAALTAGAFDAAILEAQAKANPANRVANAKAALEEPVMEEGAPEGVDLDELDEEPPVVDLESL